MLPGAHFCIPIAIGSLVNLRSVQQEGRLVFDKRALLYGGLFGVLPDLVNPHISLQARHESWSHTIWFVLGTAAVIYAYQALSRQITRPHAHFFVLALALHLFCDAITGGIYPLGPSGPLVGAYYLAPIYWLAADVATYFAAYLLHWAAHQRLRLAQAPARFTVIENRFSPLDNVR